MFYRVLENVCSGYNLHIYAMRHCLNMLASCSMLVLFLWTLVVFLSALLMRILGSSWCSFVYLALWIPDYGA